MYTLYLCIALFVLILNLLPKKGVEDKLVHHISRSIVGLVIGAFVGCVVAIVIGLWAPRHDVVYGPAAMVSLGTSNGVKGTLIWGTGSISNDMQYHFYVRNNDGSVTPRQVDADIYVSITEDKTLKDVGYWSATYSERDHSAPIAHWAAGGNTPVLISQVFRVPVGTVDHRFAAQ
jgi:hypothetical protein